MIFSFIFLPLQIWGIYCNCIRKLLEEGLPQFDESRFRNTNYLGHGAYGVVYLALDKEYLAVRSWTQFNRFTRCDEVDFKDDSEAV